MSPTPALDADELEAVLRQDFTAGVYHPREHLVEAELLDRYATTRAAVREALLRLSAAGVTERVANRGVRVRSMSLAEALEIAEVRVRLEPMCARRAAESGTAEERHRLADLARELREAAALARVGDYLAANAAFHALIHAMSGHETAAGILRNFQARPIDRAFPQPFHAQPPAASVAEHDRIAAAIVACEPAQAEAAMEEHVGSLIELLRRVGGGVGR